MERFRGVELRRTGCTGRLLHKSHALLTTFVLLRSRDPPLFARRYETYKPCPHFSTPISSLSTIGDNTKPFSVLAFRENTQSRVNKRWMDPPPPFKKENTTWLPCDLHKSDDRSSSRRRWIDEYCLRGSNGGSCPRHFSTDLGGGKANQILYPAVWRRPFQHSCPEILTRIVSRIDYIFSVKRSIGSKGGGGASLSKGSTFSVKSRLKKTTTSPSVRRFEWLDSIRRVYTRSCIPLDTTPR